MECKQCRFFSSRRNPLEKCRESSPVMCAEWVLDAVRLRKPVSWFMSANEELLGRLNSGTAVHPPSISYNRGFGGCMGRLRSCTTVHPRFTSCISSRNGGSGSSGTPPGCPWQNRGLCSPPWLVLIRKWGVCFTSVHPRLEPSCSRPPTLHDAPCTWASPIMNTVPCFVYNRAPRAAACAAAMAVSTTLALLNGAAAFVVAPGMARKAAPARPQPSCCEYHLHTLCSLWGPRQPIVLYILRIVLSWVFARRRVYTRTRAEPHLGQAPLVCLPMWHRVPQMWTAFLCTGRGRHLANAARLMFRGFCISRAASVNTDVGWCTDAESATHPCWVRPLERLFM